MEFECCLKDVWDGRSDLQGTSVSAGPCHFSVSCNTELIRFL